MTRQGTMARLGIDLGVIDATKPPDPRTPDCPGALVRVTRFDFDEYVKGGEIFQTPRSEVPVDGYGSARIRCDRLVTELPKTSAGHRQFYGLCTSCSALEVRNRSDLRERDRVRNGGSR